MEGTAEPSLMQVLLSKKERRKESVYLKLINFPESVQIFYQSESYTAAPKCRTVPYLSKSWSYRMESSPLVRYNVRPKRRITGDSGFSLQTPCNLNIVQTNVKIK